MNSKYSRPKIKPEDKSYKNSVVSRAYDFADVIIRHLNIRLKQETSQLMENCRKQANKEYIDWFNETLKRNPDLVSKVHHRLSKKSKEPIDIFKEEGKYIVGKNLLDHFVESNKKTVIELRKALALEHRQLSNNSILLTNGIELSSLFILFGSPLSKEELKTGYKTLSKHCHPDAGGSDEVFNKVNKLYKAIEENWEEWCPTNLAISLETLSYVMKMTFTDPLLIELFSK